MCGIRSRETGDLVGAHKKCSPQKKHSVSLSGFFHGKPFGRGRNFLLPPSPSDGQNLHREMERTQSGMSNRFARIPDITLATHTGCAGWKGEYLCI